MHDPLRVAIPLGLGVVILLLGLLLARLVSSAKKREILKRLGLPVNAKLSPQQANALRAFEDTDMKLQRTFPGISDKQRHVMATDVLRDKGVLPKRRSATSKSTAQRVPSVVLHREVTAKDRGIEREMG
ncbi:MAG TPA: hypothetical protein VN707_02560 [Casimicrobiaceae bacterium]|nr:hypothetical protein [Casimicrobiaceae bacterium]